ITPACAGKTKSISDHVSARKDHPRMCGKDIEKEKINGIDLGSPPHVRERLIKSLNLPEATGITPACAGKTTEGDGYLYQNRDHPRMCGKDRLFLSDHRSIHFGITPACAGKTPTMFACNSPIADHPRMC